MSRHNIEHAPLTAAEQVVDALRREIEAGKLQAGEPIRQEEVAAKLGVSRMPVRDALHLLESEGLVRVYPGRGAFVAAPDIETIHELYDIRILLETDLLRRALPSITPAILRRAEMILDEADEASDSAAWGAHDEDFHATLYRPAERPNQEQLILSLRRRVNHFFYLVRSPDEFRAHCQVQHRQILAACRSGDTEAAADALRAHLDYAASVVMQASRPSHL